MRKCSLDRPLKDALSRIVHQFFCIKVSASLLRTVVSEYIVHTTYYIQLYILSELLLLALESSKRTHHNDAQIAQSYTTTTTHVLILCQRGGVIPIDAMDKNELKALLCIFRIVR